MQRDVRHNPVRVQAITTLAEFDRCSRDWDEVVAQTPGASIHARSFWIRRWLETVGRDREIAFRLMFDDDGPLGCAAWMRETKRLGPFPVPFLRLAGEPMSKRTQVILARRQSEAAAAMMRDLRKLRWLWLDPGRVLDADPFLKACASSSVVAAADERASYILPCIATTMGWDDYLATRTRSFRKQRRRGHLGSQLSAKIYPAEFPCVEDLLAAIDVIARESWAFQEDTSVVSAGDEWSFWQKTIRDAAALNILHAACIFDGDAPVAFIFGILEHRTLYALKTAFVASSAKHGSGRFAFSALVQAAMENPEIDLVDLDFITSHGDYKAGWATRLETVKSYYAFRRGPLPGLIARAYRMKKKHAASPPETVPMGEEATA